MTTNWMSYARLNFALVVTVTTACALGTAPAHAQFWNGSTSNEWNTGSNWDGGSVPTFGDNAAIASDVHTNTIANISTANAQSDGIFVGLEINTVPVDGTVNHSAFTADFTNGMVIGRGGTTGTYNQSGLTTDPNGPSIVNTAFVAVGTEDIAAAIPEGTGFYSLSGDAALNASSHVMMGELPLSTGTMTLSGNAVVNANLGSNASIIVGREESTGTLNIHDSAVINAADRIHVGDFNGAQGTINQDGTSVVNSNVTWLGVWDGFDEGTKGTYNISGSAQLNNLSMIVGRDGGEGEFNISESADVNLNDVLVVGDFNGDGTFGIAEGVVNQSGGTVDVGIWVGIGNQAGTTGTYNLTGGTLTTGNDLKVGDFGNGTVNQDAGTVNVGSFMSVGAGSGSTGTYNLNGDAQSVLNTHSDLNVGDNGTGTFNQTGGTVTVGTANDAQGAWLYVGRGAGSQGTYNMTAGSLEVNGRFQIGGFGGEGTFNLDGGTVVANDGGLDQNGITQPGVLVVGRIGKGTFNQAPDTTATFEYIDMGGDPGIPNDATGGGTYTMTGGSLTTTSGVGIRIGLNNSGAGSVFRVEGSSSVQSAGDLEVGRGTSGAIQLFGSNLSVSFADDLSTSTGAGTGVLAWGSDAAGVSPLSIGDNVDVTDGLLQTLFVPSAGFPTVAISSPHDLLLVDNQGHSWVEGLLNFDQDFNGVGDQLLQQGDALVDPGGVLGGTTYYISYYGQTGTDNDIWLTLAPVVAVDSADFDADGDVDGDDFLIWQLGFGVGNSRPQGDANADGIVNAADKDIWQAQFGTTPAIPAVSVPEPGSLVLLATALLLAIGGQRRRRGLLPEGT